ncbi:MAG: HIT family protein [Planctomycetes bacterium]|nr:HIT family protein [Planctomycetota bacterium]
MTSIFTKIINGAMPGRFVWKDDVCVAFLSIAPLKPGHTLVVPRKEVDHWLDCDNATMAHLLRISRGIGHALMDAYKPAKVGMMIAGLEVRHLHIHLVPMNDVKDLDFSRQDPNATALDLDDAANRVRDSLRNLGYPAVSR